jgi:hypothetical protein
VPRTDQAAGRAHFDWLPHIDFVLDHPGREVWPRLVHWEEWISGYRCEHVSGSVDAPGERKRVTYWDEETDSSVADFFVEVVRLEPGRRLVYRLLPLPDGDVQPGGIGFQRGHEIFNLYELSDNQTLVTYETVAELESSTVEQSEFDATHVAEEAAASSSWLGEYVPELKRLLAEGA